jgi:NADPH:quinone reductase-like Zn-dependent oxidoreductase
VLQLREIPKPVPRDNEVLIRIHATTVSAADCQLRRSKSFLAFKLVKGIRAGPMIIGQELAGEIEEVGRAVTRFKQGVPVYAWSGLGLSTYADYTCLPEKGVLAVKPVQMTYEEAAPLAVGGLEAAYFLRRAHLQSGQKVLIVGAGGSVGTFAVQIAKACGTCVTAVDSTGKLELLRSLGADRVVDYTREEVFQNGETYDAIFDVVGKSSTSRSLQALTQGGHYLLANPRPFQGVRGRWISRRSAKQVIPWATRSPSEYAEDSGFLNELIRQGRIRTVIDRRYPLEEIPAAHRYVETGQKKGSVVILVATA